MQVTSAQMQAATVPMPFLRGGRECLRESESRERQGEVTVEIELLRVRLGESAKESQALPDSEKKRQRD